ncbi:H(+)-transporting V1 sector ATPase subunit C [Ascoidea rubescens DSM 1968]|uniref:V-type proton ATPase subunit C n=1 Tax=Ascoidea rubescens DSM 1968 TaxID=1344418 RepID=A0A1D2V9J0_9ASCO|nr:ATPase, V1 complex, subunit C [Ascoidea rubescens DSM 1968]ODV58123.1 ATPase, V1 complex, subunit C [Ascoidea rubescens DSM 1968]
MAEPLCNFLFISLPEDSTPAGFNNLETYLEQSLVNGKSIISKFNIPSFRIGTLDSLVEESEDLGKIDSQLFASLQKINDILSTIYDNNLHLLNANKSFNNKSPIEFVESFNWNYSKYRIENKSIKELTDLISSDAFDLDNDLKSLYSSYNVAKTNLSAANRKKNGDLTVRSLHDIVGPQNFVLNSDHLSTLLIVVPKALQKDWLNSYESLSDFVVPRSSQEIFNDDDYILNNVTVFKKYIPEFLLNCREKKFIPREFNYSENLINQLKREFDQASRQEYQLKAELIRLSKTSYQYILSAWFHIKSLRVFVESILRYGLPPNFNSFLIRSSNYSNLSESKKTLIKCKNDLIKQFGYLGGNAFMKDKNGKLLKDSSLNQYASLVDTDYEPFVLLDIDLY